MLERSTTSSIDGAASSVTGVLVLRALHMALLTSMIWDLVRAGALCLSFLWCVSLVLWMTSACSWPSGSGEEAEEMSPPSTGELEDNAHAERDSPETTWTPPYSTNSSLMTSGRSPIPITTFAHDTLPDDAFATSIRWCAYAEEAMIRMQIIPPNGGACIMNYPFTFGTSDEGRRAIIMATSNRSGDRPDTPGRRCGANELMWSPPSHMKIACSLAGAPPRRLTSFLDAGARLTDIVAQEAVVRPVAERRVARVFAHAQTCGPRALRDERPG